LKNLPFPEGQEPSSDAMSLIGPDKWTC